MEMMGEFEPALKAHWSITARKGLTAPRRLCCAKDILNRSAVTARPSSYLLLNWNILFTGRRIRTMIAQSNMQDGPAFAGVDLFALEHFGRLARHVLLVGQKFRRFVRDAVLAVVE
jgi:hypothetical protein